MTLTEQIAAVLAEHYDVVAGGASAPGVWFCQCGEDIARGSDDTEAKHQGHVAAHIAPLVRQAEVEALREAAGRMTVDPEALPYGALTDADLIEGGADLARRWLRERADRIEAETDGGL